MDMSLDFKKIIAVLTLAGSLSGCLAEGTAIRNGAARPATLPQNVVVYLEAPKTTYELVGVVTGEANSWTKQDSVNAAIEELKVQAAGLGANGIIITGHQTEVTYNTSTSGNVNSSGNISATTKVAALEGPEKLRATAIFVTPTN